MWWFVSLVLAAVEPKVLNPKVTNGSLVAIELDPSVSWKGRVWDTDLFIFEDQGRRLAIFGVPYQQGPSSVEVVLEGNHGESVRVPIQIESGEYPSETLRVSPKHVRPSAQDHLRIEREKKEVGAVYASPLSKKLWTRPFVFPVTTEMTSIYGTRRVFNGELQSYHNGIDFRAKVGRRIRAANSGKVVLAKHLFYTGNTVIIDHGMGVMTLYAHLSKIGVKKGQTVAQKAVVGLAGQTGRANGPHLHFSAIVNRVRVNPVDLFAYLGDRTQPPGLLKRAAPSTLETEHATATNPTLEAPSPAEPAGLPSESQ